MANIKNAERKDWNFGHFGTRHDGTVWNLIRIKDADTGLPVSDETPIASNKSATPLVALAREMNTSEKRTIKIRKLRSQVQKLAAELAALESELDITPEEAKVVPLGQIFGKQIFEKEQVKAVLRSMMARARQRINLRGGPADARTYQQVYVDDGHTPPNQAQLAVHKKNVASIRFGVLNLQV